MAESASSVLLDTSVIVRYLTNDPPEMAERAARVIEGPDPFTVSEVVLVEAAYVLSSVYAIERAPVVDALAAFVQRRNVRMLHLPKVLVVEALQSCRDSGRHSFVDVMLWAQAIHSGAPRICTFDARFPKAGVEIVQPG